MILINLYSWCFNMKNEVNMWLFKLFFMLAWNVFPIRVWDIYGNQIFHLMERNIFVQYFCPAYLHYFAITYALITFTFQNATCQNLCCFARYCQGQNGEFIWGAVQTFYRTGPIFPEGVWNLFLHANHIPKLKITISKL